MGASPTRTRATRTSGPVRPVRDRGLGRALLGLALIALGGVACGGANPQPPEQPQGQPSRPPLGALPDLVPSGAELVLVGQPPSLLKSKAVRRVLNAVVPSAQLDAFQKRTGVDPRKVEQAVLAEYPNGFLLLARGPFDAEDVVRAAGRRMARPDVAQSEPFVRRTGYLGTQRRALVALRDDVVAVGAGVPPVMAALLARVREGAWQDQAGPALTGPEVQDLRERHGKAPLVLYAPRPLQLPSGFKTSLLLAQERALAASLHPVDAEQLRIDVGLRGEFPKGAEKNFRKLVESVARTSLGAALGLGESIDSLRVRAERDAVEMRLKIPAATLARGLKLLFVADLQKVLQAPQDKP